MMNTFDLAKNVPFIHNTKELELWIKKEYILSHYMTDYDTYNDFMERLLNTIRSCYVIRACREYPIKFRFSDKDKVTHQLQFRHFIVNMILWLPFVELNDLDVLDESFILDCSKDVPNIESYINYKLITVLREYHIRSTVVNYSISEVLYNLRKLSIDFSLIMGLNFSTLTFLDMYENNEEVQAIMESTFDEKMQPYEIEQKLAELQAREIDIYKSIPDNPIGLILRTETGIKPKQFAEFTIADGLKPSLEGITIPEPISNSTMLRGLDRASYLYIAATGARELIDLRAYTERYSKKLFELLERFKQIMVPKRNNLLSFE